MPIGSRAVLRRLLALFPTDSLPYFEQVPEKTSKGNAIDAVLSGYEEQKMIEFVASNFGRLHQHVYVYAQDSRDRNEVFGEPVRVTRVGDEEHRFYLHDLVHELVVGDPLEYLKIAYVWPLKVVVAPDHIRFHMTIMDKSSKAYVEEGKRVIKTSPIPTEGDLLVRFSRSSLGFMGGCWPVDLNKGIKALWGTDSIDSNSVEHQTAVAAIKSKMHEDLLVKANAPALYSELQDKPLRGTNL